MTTRPTLDERDILLVMQSLAQAFRSGGESHVSEASLFLRVNSLEEFLPEQVQALSFAAIKFFDLDTDAKTGRELQRELCAHTGLETWAGIIYRNWGGESLSFHSSGSTGTPVRHSYSIDSITGESAASVAFFSMCKRVVSVMPVHHIFGFMYSFWIAKLLGTAVAYAPPLPLASFFAALREGDLVTGFPFFWQSLLAVIRQRNGEAAFYFPPDVMGLTATCPCPEWVSAGLLEPVGKKAIAPLVAMKEIYGSTETNGLGIRSCGSPWYELFANWQTVRLADGAKGVQRLHEGLPLGDPQPLPDVVTWHPQNDRQFRPERRMDKAVQVGGINVYPDRVAECIRAHPMVRDCMVRLMRPEEGSRLKVFIVPACPPGEAAGHFGRVFRAWLAERLDTPSRPKHIRLGANLPVNAIGKASDWN